MRVFMLLFLYTTIVLTSAYAAEKITIVHNGSVQGVLGAQSRGVQAKTVAMISQMRRRNPELLLFSCGNMLGPSVTSDLDGGALALKLMNRSAYDVMAVGPHDLFKGAENMLQKARSASFPFVWSNVQVNGELKKSSAWSKIKKQVKLNCKGRTVKVLGFIEPSAVENWPQWSADLELKGIEDTLTELKEEGDESSLVVVLGTMTFVTGLHILENNDWVDLVIAHPAAGESVPSGSTFINQFLDGRLLVWSACHGSHVAKITADAEAEKAECVAQAIAVDRYSVEDQSALAEITRLENKARSAGGKKLATLSEREQNTFAKLLLNALRYELGAEVSIIHAGALRQKMAPEKLTKRVISSAFPFPDRVAMVEVDGATLRSIYKKRNDALINDAGLEIMGMGECGSTVLINQRPIRDGDRYRVATTEFLALGGLNLLSKNPSTVRPQRFVDLLAEHFASIPDSERLKRYKKLDKRAIRRARTTVDFSISRVDFVGAAEDYQYNEPDTVFTSSDIPGFVGLEHRTYTYSLHHENVIDWPDADLTFDLKLDYSTFKAFKTVDRGSFDVTYEDQSCSNNAHLFANLNFTGSVSKTKVPGRDHPLFVKSVAGLVWKLNDYGKLFAGPGHLFRLSVDGDPGNTGLNIKYTYAKDLNKTANLSTVFDVFGSFDSDEIRTFDWTTELRFKIGGNLSTVLKSTNFLWQDSIVDDTASRREFYIGLGYDLKFRRF